MSHADGVGDRGHHEGEQIADPHKGERQRDESGNAESIGPKSGERASEGNHSGNDRSEAAVDDRARQGYNSGMGEIL